MAYIHTKNGIRESIDATGDDADFSALVGGIREVDEHGNTRELTVEDIKAQGIRQVVAVKDIFSGEWRKTR